MLKVVNGEEKDVRVYFMHRIRHYKNAQEQMVWDKGIEVYDDDEKDNFESAKGSMYAYLGVWGYGRDKNNGTDYVCCEVTDIGNNRLAWDYWDNLPKPEPPEPPVPPEEVSEPAEQEGE